ncbi:DUF1631 domain-containing protein [Leeia sp. TBRC 13508]|uniref:DUF1631 domain-containing protein n=1 Tax=Leeia speluncae TaxID=2884804 RepID=A0ABS8D4T6_9NEIS|nr:DUF1631 family protein [Leeia speluncae]MCB6183226.1 DUF1631 domain-containing protein [Leeia speluncae]
MIDRDELLSLAQKKFLAEFQKGIPAALTATESALFELAENATSIIESGKCFDARSMLTTQHNELINTLSKTLDSLSKRSLQTAYNSFRPSFKGKGLHAAELTLIDANAFEEELLIDGLTAQTRAYSYEALNELNVRIAVLFDQDEILERENPFRPFLFTKSLLNGIDSLNPPVEVHETLVINLQRHLFPLAKEIYQSLNDLLERNGISAQMQLRIRKSADSTSTAHADEENNDEELAEEATETKRTPPGTTVNTNTAANRKEIRPTQHVSSIQGMPLSNVSNLFDQLRTKAGIPSGEITEDTGSFTPQTEEKSPISFGKGLQKIGQTIRNFFNGADEFSSASFASQPQREVTHALMESISASAEAQYTQDQQFDLEVHDTKVVRNLIMEQRDQLAGKTQNANERMIIDIVAMLFEFILSDQAVPSEIRAQIGRLQFVVLKVALKDPSLFNERSHPARLLVNQLGSASLALHEVDPLGDKLIKEVKLIINDLIDDHGEHLTCFEEQLARLETFIQQQLEGAEQFIDKAEKYINQAEERTMRFTRISAMISASLEGIRLDKYLNEFLVYTWARVLEKASFHQDPEEHAYKNLISELIWSIAPKQHQSDRNVLLKMIPRLIGVLKIGLQHTTWPADKRQELLNWLVDAHTRALRPSTVVGVNIPPLEYFVKRINTVLFDPLWMQTPGDASEDEFKEFPNENFFHEVINELEGSLETFSWALEDTVAIDPTEAYADSDWLTATSTAGITPNIEVMNRLTAGVAVTLQLGSSPTTAVLRWVSKKAKHFAMTIQGQNKPVILGAKVFSRLVDTGRVKFMDDNPLFERAVNALIHTADGMDSHSDLSLS